MVKIKRVLRLYALYAKMDLAWLLRDTTFAVLAVLADVITNLSSVTGVFLLAWRFDGIGGMSRFEVLFMLAYATIITGIFQTFCAGGNVGHISRRVGRGQLEHMFIQPMLLPAQLATEGFIPFSGSSNLISGTVIMIIATVNLGISLPWWWIFSLIGNLIVTVAIVLGKSYLASSLTFYAPVQAEEISSYVIDSFGHISTFPLSGMPLYLQIPLITFIPTGLLAWFPTLALFGRAPFNLPAWYPLLFAVVLWMIATYFFRKGLNFYVKKGINRYHAMGHRR
ncbi:MAG: ABC transporter permease [Defluviitaleaceae bacterium]|nr:ABC transporter permease [Defluviitaleaceae bacterium]